MADMMLDYDSDDEDFMLGGLAVILDDEIEDEEEHELMVEQRDPRPRSCWVREWLLKRDSDQTSTLYGLICELDAVIMPFIY